MKTDYYKINNAVEKIKNGKCTNFLDMRELRLVTAKLRKNEYNIFYPYKDSEKVILYTNYLPRIKLLLINSDFDLRHQEILGSLFGLNIDGSCFGDIVLYEERYYVFVIFSMASYIINNLVMVGNKRVRLCEVPSHLLDGYVRSYEENEIIVSSLRIDSVVSSIINSSRSQVLDRLKNKEVLVNYEVLNKASYLLKCGDVFSVRRYGKYKFVGVVKCTKKNNYIVRYLRYL